LPGHGKNGPSCRCVADVLRRRSPRGTGSPADRQQSAYGEVAAGYGQPLLADPEQDSELLLADGDPCDVPCRGRTLVLTNATDGCRELLLPVMALVAATRGFSRCPGRGQADVARGEEPCDPTRRTRPAHHGRGRGSRGNEPHSLRRSIECRRHGTFPPAAGSEVTRPIDRRLESGGEGMSPIDASRPRYGAGLHPTVRLGSSSAPPHDGRTVTTVEDLDLALATWENEGGREDRPRGQDGRLEIRLERGPTGSRRPAGTGDSE
jgi:hypothetical protein